MNGRLLIRMGDRLPSCTFHIVFMGICRGGEGVENRGKEREGRGAERRREERGQIRGGRRVRECGKVCRESERKQIEAHTKQ